MLTVCVGPMMAGKTKYLMERMGAPGVLAFLPALDTRSRIGEVPALRTHDGTWAPAFDIDGPIFRAALARAPSVPLSPLHPSLPHSPPFHPTLVLDEAQFMPAWVPDAVRALADRGHDVYAAGLLRDYAGKPFGVTQAFLARADVLVSIAGTCARCSGPATETYRKTSDTTRIVIGGAEMYEPLCRACWVRARLTDGPSDADRVNPDRI